MKTRITNEIVASALLALAAAGCGQHYEPEPEKHAAGPQNPGGIFENHHPQADYEMLTYQVLRSTLVDVLEVDPSSNGALEADCVAQQLDPAVMCPRSNPVGYLEANADQLGAPQYDVENPQETYGPRLLTSGGFKVWMLAASSACGRMTAEQSAPALFANDFPDTDGFIDDYEGPFLALLGRLPTETEVARLDAMQGSFTTIERRAAGVCTVLLGNLEFLGAN